MGHLLRAAAVTAVLLPPGSTTDLHRSQRSYRYPRRVRPFDSRAVASLLPRSTLHFHSSRRRHGKPKMSGRPVSERASAAGQVGRRGLPQGRQLRSLT
jgi:hypothetical protein